MDIIAINANRRLSKTKIGCFCLVATMIEIIADKTVKGIVIKKAPKKKKTSMYTKAARTAVIIVHTFMFFNILSSPYCNKKSKR